MKLELRPALSRLLARVRPAASVVLAHRSWLQWAAAALLLIAAALVVGTGARSHAHAADRQAAELRRVARGLDAWQRTLRRPAPAESAAWLQSERELHALAREAADPLLLAQRVAQRAERIGVYGLRIGGATADTLSPPPALAVRGWALEPDPQGIRVQFGGDLGATASLIGSLPPQLRVGALQVQRRDGALEADLFLFSQSVVAEGTPAPAVDGTGS